MILLVDQDVNFLRLIQGYLESNHYQVISTTSEETALGVLATTIPGLVVAEMTPTYQASDGLFRQIRQNPLIDWLPFIFLSTKISKSDRLAALSAGASAYFVKPFNLEEFTAQVESLLRLAQRSQSRSPQYKSSILLRVPKDVKLTHTERLVGQLVLEGKSNQEISLLLNISKRTTESHISHMLKKTELTNRTELSRWMIETNL
jgi:DNA-binding NarL/FixJ family response regulator